jgi:hypothetical protein
MKRRNINPSQSIANKFVIDTPYFSFAHWLAGMVEGDGYLFVPKPAQEGKKKYLYPYCSIVFHSKDLPLIKKLVTILGTGHITKVKGAMAYRLFIKGNKNVLNLITLINGKFRTPKHLTLLKLISWFNEKYNMNIPLLPIDTSDLGSNAWLTGFSDADGSFYIRYRTRSGKNPSINTNFKLDLAAIHAQTGGSLEPIMSKIADFFGVPLYSTKDSTYRVQVESKLGFKPVINYFTEYPLLSYKSFNYMACVKVHNLMIDKAHLTQEGQTIILNTMKELVNDFETFEWSHLDNL